VLRQETHPDEPAPEHLWDRGRLLSGDTGHIMARAVSVGDIMGRGLLRTRGIPASSVCPPDGLYQQLEWACVSGGFYIQMPATGETGIYGQLLSRLSV